MTEWDGWTVLGGLGGAAGLATLPLYVLHRWQDRRAHELREEIADPAVRAELIARFQDSGRDEYYRDLKTLLDRVHAFYGTPFSYRAFDRCVLMAFAYPMLFILLGWVVFNTWSIEGLVLFVDTTESSSRLLKAFGILAAILAFAIIYVWWVPLDTKPRLYKKRIISLLGINRTPKPTMFGSFFLTFWILLGCASTVFLLMSSAESLGSELILWGVVFIYGSALASNLFNRLPSMQFSTLSIGGLSTYGIAFGNEEFSALIFLIFFLLPTSNAIADWLSLGITRLLLRDLVNRHAQGREAGRPGLILHLLADIAAALLCLGLLLAGLVALLEMWAVIHPDTLPLDWRAYWQTAQDTPGQATALWLLCATTLLPTMVHLLYVLTLSLARKSSQTRAAVADLRTLDATPSPVQITRIAKKIAAGKRRALLAVALFTTLTVAFLTLLLTVLHPGVLFLLALMLLMVIAGLSILTFVRAT